MELSPFPQGSGSSNVCPEGSEKWNSDKKMDWEDTQGMCLEVTFVEEEQYFHCVFVWSDIKVFQR